MRRILEYLLQYLKSRYLLPYVLTMVLGAIASIYSLQIDEVKAMVCNISISGVK